MRTLNRSLLHHPGRLWASLAMALAIALAASASRADVVGMADEAAPIVGAMAEPASFESSGIPVPAGRDAKPAALRATATLAPAANERPAMASPIFAGAGSARVDLKCWQYGVLILHETWLVAAAEPFTYALKFPSASAGGVPTYVAEVRNATCLIKPSTGEADATGRRR